MILIFALNVFSAKCISLPASERFILWCRQVWVFHSSCPLILVKSAAGRCRWGGVPAPLSQPEHQGSSTNIFKKEGIMGQNHSPAGVTSSLCVRQKTKIPFLQTNLTVCSHFNSSQSLRQSELASQHVEKSAWLFTQSPDSVSGCPKTFYNIICVSE